MSSLLDMYQERILTCTTVIPCLSSGLAENDKIISLPAFLATLKVRLFLRKWGGGGGGGQTLHQSVVEQDAFSQFVEGTSIK